MRRRVCMWLTAGVLAAAGACAAAQDTQPADKPVVVDHTAFDAILREHVRGERVDYLVIRDEQLPALDGYLDALAAVDTSALERDEHLAMLINLYNATMVREVVRRYEPDYTVAADDYAVFKQPLVRLEGKAMSLDALEHEVIRKAFKEPRIHVALVCGAVSCPPLLPRAYRGETLAATLEANMRRFVNDPSRNRIDEQAQRLELSQIFNWFAEDFGGRGKIADYVNAYTQADVSRYKVTYVEYDWSLNIVAAKEKP